MRSSTSRLKSKKKKTNKHPNQTIQAKKKSKKRRIKKIEEARRWNRHLWTEEGRDHRGRRWCDAQTRLEWWAGPAASARSGRDPWMDSNHHGYRPLLQELPRMQIFRANLWILMMELRRKEERRIWWGRWRRWGDGLNALDRRRYELPR